MSLVLTLAGVAMASPPIEPPIEGSIIATVTDIDIIGTVRESENLSWTITEDGNLALADYGTGAAQIRYSEELRGIDGQTRLVKDFAFHSTASESDNLDVEKDIGYAKLEGTIGQIEATEKVSLGIATSLPYFPMPEEVAGEIQLYEIPEPPCRGPGGLAGACIWNTCVPPTNEFVAAGGSVTAAVTEVHTTSNAAVTSSPRLTYTIAAVNTLGAVSAGFEVRALEGGEPYLVDTEEWEQTGYPYASDLLGLEVYSEHASASGVVTKFVKVAKYMSVIPPLQPEPYFLVP